MTINDYIAQLLYRYECVVIPDFGGFVANYNPARFDAKKKIFHAPGKRLIFNPKLTHNDGLLVNELVKNTGLSYAEAQTTLTLFVRDLKAKLNQNKYAELGSAGVLIYNQDGEIHFRQGHENFLLSSFGLNNILAIPIGEQLQEKQLERKVQQEKKPIVPVESSRVSGKKTWKRVAVAAALIPLAFYAFWLPLGTDVLRTGEFSYSDLNPFHWSVEGSYAERSANTFDFTIEKDLIEDADGQQAIEIEPGFSLAVREDVVPIPPEENMTVTNVSSKGNFVLIGGCFGEESNAHRLVNQITEKGYRPFILDQHRGLHRVAINSYANYEEALSALNHLKESGIPAWILKK